MVTTLINGTYSITATDGASLVFANISGALSLVLQNMTDGAANQWWIEGDPPAYTVKSMLYDLYITPSDTSDAFSGDVQQLVPSPEPFGWYALPDDESFAFSPDPTHPTFWTSETDSLNTNDVVLSSTRSLWTLGLVSATSSLALSDSPTAASSVAHFSSSLSIGAIAGIAAGGICGVVLLVALANFLHRRSAGYREETSDSCDREMGQYANVPRYGNTDYGLGPGVPLPTAVCTAHYPPQYPY
ncbi:hypothetical protein CERSUDRAFT_95180 [Gelatoporia subvermispora B]|uniref:Transmembrane protein n=1 Tax=Ceriporiopsis subvermispora (strain B) TaxID=914234 RepID=M2QIQ7_CERS8|nr:hypothetical protein CERSUDRAFT_95180 [Gelatoporia subvermispora B]